MSATTVFGGAAEGSPTTCCVRAFHRLPFMEIAVELRQCGSDLSATVTGGAAHIGCVALATPRPSLSGDASVSCTSSALNVIGHKDEAIVRPVTEALCRASGRTVVGVGGVHVDGITPDQLAEVAAAVEPLCDVAVTLIAELG